MHKVVVNGTTGEASQIDHTSDDDKEWEDNKTAGDAAMPNWLKGLIKKTASQKIEAFAPMWKQNNISSDMMSLQNKGSDNWTDAEKVRWDEAEAVWKKISDVRTVSDTLESSISGMNSDQMHTFARNIVKNSAWDS